MATSSGVTPPTSSERSPLLPTSSSQRKANAAPSKTQRFRQIVALVVGTAAITALLYEMTPDTPDASVKSKLGPVHIQRDTKYPFARFFATKTAYWDQRDGAESNQELLTAYENALLREDLQLRQSHLVVRHGVRYVNLCNGSVLSIHGPPFLIVMNRYPTEDNIEDIQALLAKVQRFPDAIPSWLQNYSLPYNGSMEGGLGAAGAQEMHDLARRLLRSMGHVNPVTYVPRKTHVRHTYASRTKESAKAYVAPYFFVSLIVLLFRCVLNYLLNFDNLRYVAEFFANSEAVEFIEFPKGQVRGILK